VSPGRISSVVVVVWRRSGVGSALRPVGPTPGSALLFIMYYGLQTVLLATATWLAAFPGAALDDPPGSLAPLTEIHGAFHGFSIIQGMALYPSRALSHRPLCPIPLFPVSGLAPGRPRAGRQPFPYQVGSVSLRPAADFDFRLPIEAASRIRYVLLCPTRECLACPCVRFAPPTRVAE
jgi:hypothetical protein